MKTQSDTWPKIGQRGDGRWFIDCGMVNGKRTVYTRKTKEEAELEAERIRRQEAKIGREASRLSEARTREAVRAFDRLAGTGYTLSDAVEFLLDNQAGEGGQVTVRELYDAYYQDRIDNHRSPETLRDIRCRLGAFARDFEDTLAHEITKATLQDWLRRQNGGAVSKGNIRRHVSGLLNFALQRDNIRINPAATLTTPSVRKDRRPPVLSVTDSRKLMNTCAEKDADMVPYFSLALFAGIRPAEIMRLDWSSIDWDRQEVFVGAKVSKTGNERYVKLRPNALEWLLPFRQASGPIHFSRRQFRSVREKSKVKWGHDILRHTFGSMHLAAFRNAGDTAEQMGHESSTSMLFRHYRRAVRQQDAERFWAIEPSVEAKVLALGKAG